MTDDDHAYRVTATGPFETEKDAINAVRLAAGDSLDARDTVASIGAAGNRRLLGAALEVAGVPMGAYDDQIAKWLTGWEPWVVQVIAAWVAWNRTPDSSSEGERDD